jgi:hypothetical protein
MATDYDWCLQGQERYLLGVTLVHRDYCRYDKNPKRDHDHCKFCWAKFMVEDQPDVLHEGYCTEDEDNWICPRCFHDFNAQFNWRVIEAMTPTDAEDTNNRINLT